MKAYRYTFFGVLVVFLGVLLFLLTSPSYSEENTCKDEYRTKINKCVETSSPRAIDDFVCIETDDREKMVYQIILDAKFKEIDEEVENELYKLEQEKGKYFGEGKTANHIDGIDYIVSKFSPNNSEYLTDYLNACGVEIIRDAIACSGDETTSINKAHNYFAESESLCIRLAVTKLYIAQEVALNILSLNKHEVRLDTFQERTQQQRTQYDELLNSMMINQSYIQEILQKTPYINKNIYK